MKACLLLIAGAMLAGCGSSSSDVDTAGSGGGDASTDANRAADSQDVGADASVSVETGTDATSVIDSGADAGNGDGANASDANETGTDSSLVESGSDGSDAKETGTDSSSADAKGRGPSCPATPACNAEPPDPGETRDWKRWESSIVAASGSANHRGRDMFYNPGDSQWIMAKFAYGWVDTNLVGEDVDIYLSRGCGTSWELLGTATTTNEGEHETEEGVEDTGGKVYFKIPTEKALGLGRHRVRLVVAGDHSSTELFIEVVAPETPLFVSDIDGTLTLDDTEQWTALLSGTVAENFPDSPQALQLLVDQGYRPMYLTARPDWLVATSREFLAVKGYPPGILHTTLFIKGASGEQAAQYKTEELAAIGARGLIPSYAFGNADTDALAYHNAGIIPDHCIFINYTDTLYGSRTISTWTELLPEFAALTPVCN